MSTYLLDSSSIQQHVLSTSHQNIQIQRPCLYTRLSGSPKCPSVSHTPANPPSTIHDPYKSLTTPSRSRCPHKANSRSCITARHDLVSIESDPVTCTPYLRSHQRKRLHAITHLRPVGQQLVPYLSLHIDGQSQPRPEHIALMV
jgi:hypothetical protein